MKQIKRIAAIVTTIIFWGSLGLLLLLYINPAGLVLMLSGFQSEGDTVDYLKTIETVRGSECYLPWPVSQTAGIQYPPHSISRIQVNHWSLPDSFAEFSADELMVEQLEYGQTTMGYTMIYAEYTEQGLNDLWGQTLSSFAQPQPELTERVENARVDLKSDAIVIYADVNMGTKWQEVGIILRLNKEKLRFEVDGVDVAGKYYTSPTEGTVAKLVTRLETNINEVLETARLIDSNALFVIHHIAIHEDRIQILAGWEGMPRFLPVCPTDWSLMQVDGGMQSVRRLTNIEVKHWALPDERLVFETNTLGVQRLERGITTEGDPVYYTKIGETALNTLWQEELYQYVNWSPDLLARVRNLRVELETGTVIVYADLQIGTRWQQVGIILTLDEKTPQLQVAGVEIDGHWHSPSSNSVVSVLVNQIEENINEVLRSARFVDPTGAELPLHSLAIEEEWLLLLARN